MDNGRTIFSDQTWTQNTENRSTNRNQNYNNKSNNRRTFQNQTASRPPNNRQNNRGHSQSTYNNDRNGNQNRNRFRSTSPAYKDRIQSRSPTPRRNERRPNPPVPEIQPPERELESEQFQQRRQSVNWENFQYQIPNHPPPRDNFVENTRQPLPGPPIQQHYQPVLQHTYGVSAPPPHQLTPNFLIHPFQRGWI